MNKKISFIYSLAALLTAPLVTFALPAANPLAIDNFLAAVLNLMWAVFATFAVVMFIVAGIQFLSAQGEPGKVNTARQSVIWGVVGVGVALLSVSIPVIMQLYLGV